jgi:hypothetical protein
VVQDPTKWVHLNTSAVPLNQNQVFAANKAQNTQRVDVSLLARLALLCGE